MIQYLPEPIKALTALFRTLPGIGPKTALRFVYALLARPKEDAHRLARALLALHDHVKKCASCGAYAVSDPCAVCRDESRDNNVICVVAESRDIAVIESTNEFHGRYHVLGGLLSPVEGITPDLLRISELTERLKTNAVKEVVLAFSADIRGETTVLYLAKQLSPYSVKITRLARGLPLGAELEYADEVTLADALRGRRAVE